MDQGQDQEATNNANGPRPQQEQEASQAANNGNNANGPRPQQDQEAAQAANNVNNANAPPRPQQRPPISQKGLIIIIAIVASVILLVIIVSLILVIVLVKKARAGDSNEPLGTPFSAAEQKKWVDAHNKYRGMVTPPAKDMETMVWDNAIAKEAQEWADNCILSPKKYFGKMGQNLFAYTQSESKDVETSAVKAWFSERTHYNYKNNSCAKDKWCGHYIQLVWANSTKVGCGRSKEGCYKGRYTVNTIIACNYFPAGNNFGEWPYKA